MLPYIRPEDCLFSIIYTLTSKMRPGGAFLFSEAREALLPGGTTTYTLVYARTRARPRRTDESGVAGARARPEIL